MILERKCGGWGEREREKEREREREREKEKERNTPLSGIEPANFWCIG